MANTENYTSKFKVDISDLKKGITEANKTIRTANAEFKNAVAGTDDWSKSTDGLSAKIKQQESVVEAEKKKLELLKEQLVRLHQNQEDGKQIISELNQKYQDAVTVYGETSEEAKKYAQQLTDAKAAQERNAKAVEELELKIINQDTAVKNAESQVKKYQSALEALQNHMETLTEKVQRQQSELDELKQKYINVAAEQSKNSEEAKELASQISDLSSELKDNKNKLQDTEQAADTLDNSLEDVGDSADKTTKGGLNAFAVALGNLASKALVGVIDKLKEMAKQTFETGTSFDSAMSQVAGTFGYTTKQLDDSTSEMSKNMQDLRDYSKEIGEKTKFSATEAAEGMNYAAMAGWKSQEILDGYDGIVDLAAASNTELATASDILTDALTAMGKSAGEAGHFADVMAVTSSNANTNVELMGETFQYVAPVAGSMGASIEDLAIATGLMANSGIKGSQAGNSLKNSLTNLVKPLKAQITAMENLGLMTTETATKIDQAEIDKAMSKVADKTGDLEKKQIAYNTAVSNYGAESSQAQTKLIDLEQAERKLEEAQNALTIAQKGTIETIGTGQSAFTDESGNMKSLGEIMNVLRSSLKAVNIDLIDSEGNIKEYDDMISELEQSEDGLAQAEQLKNAAIIFGKQNLAGMLAIINASEEDYNKLTDAVYNSKDAAKNMSETMIDNLGGDLTILQSKLQAIQIAIYEKFEPSLRKIAEWVGKVMDSALSKIEEVSLVIETAINWVTEHGNEIIGVLSGVVAGIIAFKAVTTIQKAISTFQALASMIQLVGVKQLALNLIMSANPVGLVVAAIAGLVTAFVVLWNKSGKFRNFWIGLWEEIQNTLYHFFEAWKTGWNTIKDFFADLWSGFIESIILGWETISNFFSDAWNSFQEIFQIGMDNIVNFFKNGWKNTKSIFQDTKNFFVQKFQDAWDGVKNVFSTVGSFFSGVWNTIKNQFTSIGTKIGEVVGNAFKTAMNAVISTIENGLNFIPNAVNGMLQLITDLTGKEMNLMPTVSLPRLAKGGIVRKATLAEIGEDGAEAVLPLEHNKAGLKMLAGILSAEIQKTIRIQADSGNTGANIVNHNYHFTQNNTSPKALSRAEIYRQTKNLIRTVRRG